MHPETWKRQMEKKKEYLLEFSLGGWPLIVEVWYWFCLDDQVLSQLFNGCIFLFLYMLLLYKQPSYLIKSICKR